MSPSVASVVDPSNAEEKVEIISDIAERSPVSVVIGKDTEAGIPPNVVVKFAPSTQLEPVIPLLFVAKPFPEEMNPSLLVVSVADDRNKL